MICNFRLGIKADNVKILSTPHYYGLTVETFVNYIDEINGLKDYFPDKKDERMRLPRSFIINVMYSRVGVKIKDWVKTVIEERNKRLISKQDIGLQLDDEIRAAFLSST